MTAPASSASPEHLLAQAGWLRRLAHHLVRDGAMAQDAVQEVWERAQRSPPAEGRPPRPWLAEVLRNIVRMQVRGDRRRAHHQARAAREAPPPWTESAETRFERLEMHRAVVEIVMALDEPLRTAVLLRYFEEHSSAEIARATGVPAGTVRWRLSTAVEKIRGELDRRFGGDRRRWALVLAPLGKGALIIMAKSKATVAVAAVLVLLVMVGGGAWLIERRVGSPDTLSSGGEERSRGGRSGWVLPTDDTTGTGEVAGTVLTPDGKPVAGAALTLIGSTAQNDRQPPAVVASASSDGQGRFRMTGVAKGTYQAAAMADGWAPGRRSGIAVEANATAQADIRLQPGGLVLRGRVTDVGGGPVAQALVVAVASFAGADGRSGPYVLRALTGADGAYRLPSRAGTHRLRVEASGYAPAEAFLALEDDRTRDFQLAPAARVSGRVLARGSRQPIADAEVLLSGDDDAGPQPLERDPVRTDADGRFVFQNVQPGRHALTARKGELTGAALALTVNAAEQVERELLIDPAAAVSGRVVDRTGAPLAGVVVRLAREMFNRERSLKTRVDGGGRFRFEGVLPGLYRVTAQEDETMSLDGTAVAVGRADVDGVEVQLERMARISGETRGPDGRPAAEVEVNVMASVHRPNRMMQLSRPALSDEQGRFERLIPAGQITVSVNDPLAGQAREVLGDVGAGERRQVVLRLRPGGQARVSGFVRNEGGGPAAGLPVQARAGRSSARARSDAEGRFDLAGLDGGPVTLTAVADEDVRYRGPWNQAEVELTLGETEHRRDVVLTLPPRDRIAGRVLGPDGQPAVGVTVIGAVEHENHLSTGGARRTSAGADGSFVLEDLPKRPHTVWAIHDAYPDVELTGVPTGGAEIVLRFRPAARIRGQVVSPSGEPVQDFFVSAQPKGATPGRPRRPARQVRDPSGSFEVTRLRPASYTVEARSAAGERAEVEVSLAEGESRDGVRLVLEPATTVTGRVVDFDTGAPVSGAEVQASVAMGVVSTRTDERGAFQLDRIPRSGRPRLAWGIAGYHSDGLVIEPPPPGGRPEPLLLKLMKGSDADRPGRRGTHGLTVESSGRTVLIRAVKPATPAAQAGISNGDFLVAIDGKPLDGLGEGGVNRLLGRAPGTPLALRVRTGAAPPREVKLTLGEPPSR